MAEIVHGFDISHWQGGVNYMAAKNAGIQRVRYRAGSIREADGVCYHDYAFPTHVLEVPRFWQADENGTYWFFRNKWSATLQADFYSDLIDDQWQDGNKWACDNEVRDAPPAMIADKTELFIDRMIYNFGAGTGEMYSSPSFINEMGNPSYLTKVDLWVAHWNRQAPTVPLPWEDWLIWQYTVARGQGPVYGVESQDIDLDWFKVVETPEPEGCLTALLRSLSL